MSVTIAIGCSLLILNVLIFAGVYYRRDKSRLEVKSLQQQRMMNQQCGPREFTELKPLAAPHRHFVPGGQVIVDVEDEMLRRFVIRLRDSRHPLKLQRCFDRNAMKGNPIDPNAMMQGTHTLPHQHHYQKQHQQHATLPRASVIPEINVQTQVSDCCHFYKTLKNSK